MPNRNTHMLAGGITGGCNYLLQHKKNNMEINILELIGVFASSSVVGVLADIIDPPSNPNHRSLGHSLGINTMLIPHLWKLIENNENMSFKQKKFYQSLIYAYGSHLILDSTTPKGLPLIS